MYEQDELHSARRHSRFPSGLPAGPLPAHVPDVLGARGWCRRWVSPAPTLQPGASSRRAGCSSRPSSSRSPRAMRATWCGPRHEATAAVEVTADQSWPRGLLCLRVRLVRGGGAIAGDGGGWARARAVRHKAGLCLRRAKPALHYASGFGGSGTVGLRGTA
jgi:hypothetical protein